MKKKFIIGFVLILIALSFVFDILITEKVSLIRNIFLDDFLLGITFVSSEIIVFFFLTSLFLWSGHKRQWILPLWVTLALSVATSFILKFSIKRPRPFQQGIVSVLPILEKTSHAVWNFSFPSFQAMLVFCAVPILAKKFPKLKYFWIIFACLVAFSRVYFGLHFMSDVLVGGLIGYLLGIGVIKIKEKKLIKHF
jgi:undecaprenyl-diphosphatase